jgi:hypothetical protein
MFFFFNWELISSPDDLIDVTQGNEVVEIYIHDINGCRPTNRYTFPIVQSGLSFALLKVNILYQKDKCSETLKNISVNIKILRGKEQRIIYTNNFVLLASQYTNGKVIRIPIHRVWHCQDYYRMFIINGLASLLTTRPLNYF